MTSSLSTEEKLGILTQDSRYDLACACGTSTEDQRLRSAEGRWIYPVVLPEGRKTYLLKTLLSNACSNDCKYCPLRTGQDRRRCTLGIEETARTFLGLHETGRVSGLFLSSGVLGTADATMERINGVARVLRRGGFRGYIHLKIIPGASPAAVEEAISLSSAVSLNIETAGDANFRVLGTKKDYLRDIVEPLRRISSMVGKGTRHPRVKQTTQFIVGAGEEKDRDLVKYTWGLYRRLRMSRVYFSAYQQGMGAPDLPGERSTRKQGDLLTREHRLYQVDWLLRKYGFEEEEIPFESDGNLSLSQDPKEIHALRHPELFPMDINRAEERALLRIPGLGPESVRRILAMRRAGKKLGSMEDLGAPCARLRKAQPFIRFVS